MATISPPIPGVWVYFKGFDVDDPFDHLHEPGSSDPMPNVYLIDGDTVGGDNRPVSGSDLVVGNAELPTNEFGQARLPLTVTMQPGNNYRAAATLLTDAREQAHQADADALSVKYADDGTARPNGSFSGYQCPVVWSEMLTVWRHLWIERDTMAAPDPIDFRVVSAVTALYPTPGRPGTSTVEIACPQAGNTDANNYEGGALTFANCPTGFDTFGILENYPCNDFLPYRIIIVGTPGACAAVGSACSFYDDDDMNALGTSASPRFPDGGQLLATAFNPAYIQPQYNLDVQSVVPFETYLDYWEILSGAGSWNNAHTLASTVDYWSCMVLGAWEGGNDRFEINTNGDGDPDGCPLIPGPLAPGAEVSLTGARRPGATEALVFFQSLSDEGACLAQTDEPHTVVHEIAHTCGDLDHKTGTIMEEGAPTRENEFDAEQLSVLRGQAPW